MAKKPSTKKIKAVKPTKKQKPMQSIAARKLRAALAAHKSADPVLALGQSEEENTPVDELIKKGKDQGYLTQDDVLQVFPEAESNLEQLEELYIVLFDEGISVVEAEKPAAPDEAEEEAKPEDIDLSAIGIDDTVSLYLKEISRIPLLTAAQEVEYARGMITEWYVNDSTFVSHQTRQCHHFILIHHGIVADTTFCWNAVVTVLYAPRFDYLEFTVDLHREFHVINTVAHPDLIEESARVACDLRSFFKVFFYAFKETGI